MTLSGKTVYLLCMCVCLCVCVCVCVAKNTSVKLELVKPNSETMSQPIHNISGNLSIKNIRQKNIWQRVVKVPLKSFLYFRCGILKLTYVGDTKKISWKNTQKHQITYSYLHESKTCPRSVLRHYNFRHF